MSEVDETSWEMGGGDGQDAGEVVDDRRDTSKENAYRRSIFGVPIPMTVSLGEVRISVSEVLGLAPDAVVPLSSKIEDLVDLKVDNRVIAKGELIETEEGGLAVKIIEIMEEPEDETE